MLETSSEQEDYFPPNVIVKVNNKLCPLPVSNIKSNNNNVPGLEGRHKIRTLNDLNLKKYNKILNCDQKSFKPSKMLLKFWDFKTKDFCVYFLALT